MNIEEIRELTGNERRDLLPSIGWLQSRAEAWWSL